MVNRCPVCKAKLWSDSFFSRRLRCPRCGTEFRPTVPLIYFRMVVFVLLCLVVILLLLLTGETLWTLLMLVLGILVFFWYLPRLIDLQQIPGDVPVAEGPVNGEELHLSLKYSNWHKREENNGDEEGNLYFFILVGALVVLVAAFLVFLLS